MFPTVIDNSMREAFTACPTRFWRGYVQNYTLPNISVHLHAGAAYARGLEVMRQHFYEQGADEQTAILEGTRALMLAYGDFVPPDKSPKTLERMMGALEFYSDKYPMADDYVKPYIDGTGKAALEFTFAIPLPIKHPETGEPIIYAGRFDMMGVYQNDMLVVYDDKTASQLGQSWSAKWKLASQFTGYSWAARQFGFDVQAVIVRGVSILKTDYGTAEVITYRPQWMIDRWYEQLLGEIREMIAMYESGKWKLSQADACSSYGGCMFTDLCDKENPDNWIATQFIVREYDPLKIVE